MAVEDLTSKEDSTTIVEVMASGIHDSTAEPLPLPVVMNPLLLSSACSGSWQELEFLLNRGINQAQPSIKPSQAFLDLLMAYGSDSCINKSASTQQVSDDIEAFLNLPSTVVSLLDGVTAEGGTVLHVVATYGDSDGFLRSVDIIHSKAKHLLFAQNNNGDTPLHCAVRPGMFRMVSHLISLARDENTSVNRVKEFLEMENKLKETALHQAVHTGNNDIVKLLMEEYSVGQFSKRRHFTSVPSHLAGRGHHCRDTL